MEAVAVLGTGGRCAEPGTTRSAPRSRAPGPHTASVVPAAVVRSSAALIARSRALLECGRVVGVPDVAGGLCGELRRHRGLGQQEPDSEERGGHGGPGVMALGPPCSSPRRPAGFPPGPASPAGGPPGIPITRRRVQPRRTARGQFRSGLLRPLCLTLESACKEGSCECSHNCDADCQHGEFLSSMWIHHAPITLLFLCCLLRIA